MCPANPGRPRCQVCTGQQAEVTAGPRGPGGWGGWGRWGRWGEGAAVKQWFECMTETFCCTSPANQLKLVGVPVPVTSPIGWLSYENKNQRGCWRNVPPVKSVQVCISLCPPPAFFLTLDGKTFTYLKASLAISETLSLSPWPSECATLSARPLRSSWLAERRGWWVARSQRDCFASGLETLSTEGPGQSWDTAPLLHPCCWTFCFSGG